MLTSVRAPADYDDEEAGGDAPHHLSRSAGADDEQPAPSFDLRGEAGSRPPPRSRARPVAAAAPYSPPPETRVDVDALLHQLRGGASLAAATSAASVPAAPRRAGKPSARAYAAPAPPPVVSPPPPLPPPAELEPHRPSPPSPTLSSADEGPIERALTEVKRRARVSERPAAAPWRNLLVWLVVVAFALSIASLALTLRLRSDQADAAARLEVVEKRLPDPSSAAAPATPERPLVGAPRGPDRPADDDSLAAAKIMLSFVVPQPPSATDEVVVSLRQLVLDEADERSSAAALKPGVSVRFLGLCCDVPADSNATQPSAAPRRSRLRCDTEDNARLDAEAMTLTFDRKLVGRECNAIVFFK